MNYSLFDEVDNPTLQAYNRAKMLITVKERDGRETAESYALNFSEKDRVKMFFIYQQVQASSWEEVARQVKAGMS